MENEFIRRESEHYDYPQLCKYQDKNIKKTTNTSTSKNKETAIYIHVPFCKSFCVFCNYYKLKSVLSDELIQEYQNAIITEIKYYADQNIIGGEISGIHFGGGTPSVLPTKVIDNILMEIRKRFSLSEKCEISMEGNIKDLSNPVYAKEIAECGINRISYGVQTLDDSLRKTYGLVSNKNLIFDSYNYLNRSGIDNVNVDLMYGFPEQQPETVISDIEEMMKLGVNCIDLYALNVFPNTPLYRKYELENKLQNYKENNNLKKYLSIYEYIHESGMNFVMSNTISKKTKDASNYLRIHLGNNELDGGNVIGIGPSAKGNIGRFHYKNHVIFEDYINQIKESNSGINLYDDITEYEANRRLLVLFPNFTYISKKEAIFDKNDIQLILDLINNGYMYETADEYRLTYKGMFYAGNISSVFYSKNQKKKMMKSTLYNMSNKVNFYNQDKL